MAFFGLLNKPRYNGRKFDDEERELSIDLRRQRAELRKKEFEVEKMMLELDMERIHQELQEVRGPDNGLNPEVLLMQLLTSRGVLNPLSNQPQPSTVPTVRSLTDDEIRAMIANFDKKQQKFAAKLPDEVLMQHAARIFPGYDAATYERAIRILKSA